MAAKWYLPLISHFLRSTLVSLNLKVTNYENVGIIVAQTDDHNNNDAYSIMDFIVYIRQIFNIDWLFVVIYRQFKLHRF
mgnify:CR=1 FL=1